MPLRLLLRIFHRSLRQFWGSFWSLGLARWRRLVLVRSLLSASREGTAVMRDETWRCVECVEAGWDGWDGSSEAAGDVRVPLPSLRLRVPSAFARLLQARGWKREGARRRFVLAAKWARRLLRERLAVGLARWSRWPVGERRRSGKRCWHW